MADRLLKPVRVLGVVLLTGFILAGLATNLQHVSYIGMAFIAVLLVNAAGLAVGYGASRLAKLSQAGQSSVSKSSWG